MTAMPTVGFIYPDHAAEDDYPLAAQWLAADFPVAHIYGTDLHAVAELLDLGSPDRLAEGARLLAPSRPQAVVWACTSGSFVYGPQGAEDQVAQLEQVTRVPTSSTSRAYREALAALGLTRVAVAASYPDDVARLFAGYLASAGVEVVSFSSAGIDTAAEVGRLSAPEVTELAIGNDHADAQALLVPDTAMRTLAVLPDLERRLGKPVLTANQVTIWEGLRLAGAPRYSPRLGALFTERTADAGR